MLLPGGRSLLAIDHRKGNITLHRIGVEDDQTSLPVVANVRLGEKPVCCIVDKELLVTMSPCPVLIYFRGQRLDNSLSVPYLPDRIIPRWSSTIWIIKINHREGAMNLETTFRLPIEGGRPRIDGRERVVGFLDELPGRVTFIHLDYPGVTVEAGIPPPYARAERGPVSGPYFFSLSADLTWVSRTTRGTFPCQPKT